MSTRAQRLTELGQLRSDGLISDEEYASMRIKLLNEFRSLNSRVTHEAAVDEPTTEAPTRVTDGRSRANASDDGSASAVTRSSTTMLFAFVAAFLVVGLSVFEDGSTAYDATLTIAIFAALIIGAIKAFRGE